MMQSVEASCLGSRQGNGRADNASVGKTNKQWELPRQKQVIGTHVSVRKEHVVSNGEFRVNHKGAYRNPSKK